MNQWGTKQGLRFDTSCNISSTTHIELSTADTADGLGIHMKINI